MYRFTFIMPMPSAAIKRYMYSFGDELVSDVKLEKVYDVILHDLDSLGLGQDEPELVRKLMNCWFEDNNIDIQCVVSIEMNRFHRNEDIEIIFKYPTKEEAVMARLTINL